MLSPHYLRANRHGLKGNWRPPSPLLAPFDKETGKQKEYKVRINDLVKHGDTKANVLLAPGDVIIIPESMF